MSWRERYNAILAILLDLKTFNNVFYNENLRLDVGVRIQTTRDLKSDKLFLEFEVHQSAAKLKPLAIMCDRRRT